MNNSGDKNDRYSHQKLKAFNRIFSFEMISNLTDVLSETDNDDEN